MNKHDLIKIPFQSLRLISNDEDQLQQYIAVQDEQLLPTGFIRITDEQKAVIRDFAKDQVTDIPIWLKIYLSLRGDDL
jgi:hypothetical protein